MADLKTNYVDDKLDTSKNQLRKYNMITNDDGTVSFVDVTTYTTQGTSFGAKDVNDTNAAVNELNLKMDGKVKKPLYASREIISPIGKKTFNNDVYVAVSYHGGTSFSFCDIYINENPIWSGWLRGEGEKFDTTPYFYIPKGQPIYATLSGDIYESRFLIVPCTN